jgi:hypothetical protein
VRLPANLSSSTGALATTLVVVPTEECPSVVVEVDGPAVVVVVNGAVVVTIRGELVVVSVGGRSTDRAVVVESGAVFDVAVVVVVVVDGAVLRCCPVVVLAFVVLEVLESPEEPVVGLT